MAKVINIKWETDGYEIDLPNEVTIPVASWIRMQVRM